MDLRQQLSDYLGNAGAAVEIVVTENNSVYTNPGKQSTSIVNGLFLLDPKNITLVSLGCAAFLAIGVACWLTRSTPVQAMRESRRLVDAMGWAVALPHMLAVLGLLFVEAGVGKAVASVVTTSINIDTGTDGLVDGVVDGGHRKLHKRLDV